MVSLGQSSGKFHFPSRIEGNGVVVIKFNLLKNENAFVDGRKYVVLQPSGQVKKIGQTSVHIPDIFF